MDVDDDLMDELVTIQYGGYTYQLDYKGARGATWRCNEYFNTRCRAKVTTNDGFVISTYKDHNHPINAAPEIDAETCEAAPEIDAETREAATSTTTDAPSEPTESGSKNEVKKTYPNLLEGGFTYCRTSQNPNGTIYWRCKEVRRMGCMARLKTEGNEVIKYSPDEHNHNPDGTPKIDAETHEAGTSTTGAPESPGSGSQNEVENTSKWRDRGYTFNRNYDNPRGSVFWSCEEYWRLDCPARLTTNGDQILLRHRDHNHNPDGTPTIDSETPEAGTSTTDDPQRAETDTEDDEPIMPDENE